MKSFLGPGMPTKEVWQNICRKAVLLKEIKSNVLSKSGVDIEDSGAQREKRFEMEALMMRREFRKVGYLGKPEDESYMESIEGKELDSHLCDFLHVAKSNYGLYKSNYAAKGEFSPVNFEPVFVTDDERTEYNSIESKIKAEIEVIILGIINNFVDEALITEHKKKLKTKKTKIQLISFYYECTDLAASLSAERQVAEENDEKEKSTN